MAETKAALPAPDAQDSLAGALIEEDPSSVWGLDSGPLAGARPAAPVPPPPPAGVRSAQAAPEPGAPSGAAAASKTPAPAAPRPTPAQDTFDDDLDAPRKKGGMLKWVFAGFLVVAVGGALLVVLFSVIAIVAAMYLPTSGSSVAASDPVVQPDAQEPKVALPSGGRIVDEGREPPDSKQYGQRVVLKLTGDSAAAVTITGSLGLRAEWDGKAPFDLGRVQAGKYRTIVVPASSGEKVRGTGFEVEAGKSCEFTFDAGAGDWRGGCS